MENVSAFITKNPGASLMILLLAAIILTGIILLFIALKGYDKEESRDEIADAEYDAFRNK